MDPLQRKAHQGPDWCRKQDVLRVNRSSEDRVHTGCDVRCVPSNHQSTYMRQHPCLILGCFAGPDLKNCNELHPRQGSHGECVASSVHVRTVPGVDSLKPHPKGVFTLGDARSFSGLTSKIPPLVSTLNFDDDVKNPTARHQCENR